VDWRARAVFIADLVNVREFGPDVSDDIVFLTINLLDRLLTLPPAAGQQSSTFAGMNLGALGLTCYALASRYLGAEAGWGITLAIMQSITARFPRVQATPPPEGWGTLQRQVLEALDNRLEVVNPMQYLAAFEQVLRHPLSPPSRSLIVYLMQLYATAREAVLLPPSLLFASCVAFVLHLGAGPRGSAATEEEEEVLHQLSTLHARMRQLVQVLGQDGGPYRHPLRYPIALKFDGAQHHHVARVVQAWMERVPPRRAP
jgi:hypothetical protein